MKKPIISIICAIGKNRAIGKNNGLLWHIPEDLKRFRELTLGHAVIMGRKTYESIGKALPERTNIVISRDLSFVAPGVITASSLEGAIKKAKEVEKEEIFFIGGEQVYQQAIGLADKLYLTIVEGEFEADTFFPGYFDFKKVVFEKESFDKNYKYKFLELEK